MDNFRDVDFEEVEQESQKNIRGKILYYSTSQVAQVLGESDSKIRYYTSAFDQILNIEISNKQRRYTEKDIEKLKFIIDLKNNGMTIKQILEYCQEVTFDSESGVQIKETNPLSIQTLAKALMEEQHKQMIQFKEEVLETISTHLNNQAEIIKENNENIKSEIIEKVAIAVDGVIDDKWNGLLENQKTQMEIQTQNVGNLVKETIKNEIGDSLISEIDAVKECIISQEQQATHKIDSLMAVLEERRKKHEEELKEKEKNKGFFGKIFSK